MHSSVELVRARWRPTATTAAWLITVPLAGLAGARLAGYDDRALVLAGNGATPLVYLPAYGALAVGILGRQRALTAVAASLVVAHVAWVAPELRGRKEVPAEVEAGLRGPNALIGLADQGGPGQRGPRAVSSGRAQKLRVATANVRFNNRNPIALGRELAGWEADVLFLQELTPDHLVPFKEAGAFERYPYSYVDARYGSFGGGIWSRYPLSEGETFTLGGYPFVRAVADVDGQPVRLVNVHAKAPSRNWAVPFWKEQLAGLGREARADSRPVVIAGDFNATYGHRPFRDLLAAGLKEAHIEAGRGWAVTWPRGGRVIPPVYRLDHVLVSSDVAVLGVREGRGKGSDHRPVIADLALPRR